MAIPTEMALTHSRFFTSPAAGEVIDCMRRASKIYVTAHIIPDGDTIGSALGLYWALVQLGKQVRVACADPVPDSFTFLPGYDLIKPQKPSGDELIVMLDSSDLQRLGSLYDGALYRERPLINIDHHVTNLRFGTLNWIEPRAASTAEIVVEVAQALGAAINQHVAVCLLTGIATDTLAFRTANTTPELMETVAQLMRAGAPLNLIIERTFNTRELSDIKLQGMIFASLHVEDGLIWSDNTLAMRNLAGAGDAAGSGTGTALLAARTANVSIIFVEKQPHRVEVSFRSRPGYDISPIAFALGGGGHPQAAGCTLSMSLAEAHETVLPKVRALLSTSAKP